MFKGNKKSLEQRSLEAIDVFTKTANDLESINTEIDAEVNAKNNEIIRLTAEADQLKNRAGQNNKIITNIKKILE